MNTDDILPIGTRVRSYDFRGHKDCYIEGVIDGYGGDVLPSDIHYRVRPDKRVWEGQMVTFNPDRFVYPPFRVTYGSGNVEYLVEKIDG